MSDQPKWTPGPWRTGPSDDTLVLGADDTEIARMSGDYEDRLECHVMDANGRLVAAAPSLYGAGKAQAAIIRRAQAVLTQYLAPDGIDASAAVDQLLDVLDGPDQRAAQAAWDAAVLSALGPTLMWRGLSARSPRGDLYEVTRLSENVWQTTRNGSPFSGWEATLEAAKAVAQSDCAKARGQA